MAGTMQEGRHSCRLVPVRQGGKIVAISTYRCPINSICSQISRLFVRRDFVGLGKKHYEKKGVNVLSDVAAQTQV